MGPSVSRVRTQKYLTGQTITHHQQILILID
jgi:hypothetical protein